MARALVLSLALAFAGVAFAPAPAHAADTWSDPHPGVRRLHRTLTNQNLNVLVVDLCAPGVSVRATASGERQRTVSSFGALVGAQAAVNGDFFSYTDYSTNGPSRGNGGAWGGADHGYVAPVQFGPGQVALPPHEGTGGVEAWAREVVSGHPSMLVGGVRRDNNGDSLCTARHPRTALGLNADKTRLYLMVVDGRATGRAGMTCDEMIAQLQGLGVTDAVNLDGGGSSTMWVAGTGVVNFPSDGSQRVVANHLAIRATGSGGSPNCPVRVYDASAPAMDAPMEMTSGEEAVVWVELKNDGNVTWDVAQTRVGTQDPQDRPSAFWKDGNWLSPSRPSGADHSTYAPGMVGRFTWVMVAPEVDATTRFDETFQLVQEGVTWFGPKTTMSIVVHPRSGPTEPDAGEEPDPGADGDAGVDPVDPGGSPDGGCSTGAGGAAPWLVLVALALLYRGKSSTRTAPPSSVQCRADTAPVTQAQVGSPAQAAGSGTHFVRSSGRPSSSVA